MLRERPRSCRKRTYERGDTLVELLISITVLATGVLGIYAALTSTVVASDMVRARADVAQVVTQVSDAIQRAGWECADTPTDSYRDLLTGLKPRETWTIRLTDMSHWGPSRRFESGCGAADAPAIFRTQRLSILIEVPGGRASQSIELVKRP